MRCRYIEGKDEFNKISKIKLFLKMQNVLIMLLTLTPAKYITKLITEKNSNVEPNKDSIITLN